MPMYPLPSRALPLNGSRLLACFFAIMQGRPTPPSSEKHPFFFHAALLLPHKEVVLASLVATTSVRNRTAQQKKTKQERAHENLLHFHRNLWGRKEAWWWPSRFCRSRTRNLIYSSPASFRYSRTRKNIENVPSKL